MDLTDGIALVTGGGSGIGLGIARALAAEGCRVMIAGRTEATLHKAAESVRTQPRLRWMVCDVTDRGAVARLFDAVRDELGSPDILVNSAGINVANRRMDNVDPADFDRVVATSLTGTFNCIHAALPGMREKGAGLIVNVTSIAGKRVSALAGVPYCAAKAGASALGTIIGLDEWEHGIKVTNIYPGETNTPILDHRPSPPPVEKRARMLQPEDVAACVIAIAKLPLRAVVPELVVTPPYMLLD